jgi:hypothetical protein
LKMCLYYCTVFLVACTFAKLNISFVMSTCLSVRPPLCMELGSYLNGLSWKLALEESVLISVRKIQVSFKLDNQTVLYIKTFSHLWHLAEFFLKLNCSQHFRENQYIHFMFINFPRIVPPVTKVPDRPLTIWRMRSVCWMHARTPWLRESASCFVIRTILVLSHMAYSIFSLFLRSLRSRVCSSSSTYAQNLLLLVISSLTVTQFMRVNSSVYTDYLPHHNYDGVSFFLQKWDHKPELLGQSDAQASARNRPTYRAATFFSAPWHPRHLYQLHLTTRFLAHRKHTASPIARHSLSSVCCDNRTKRCVATFKDGGTYNYHCALHN